MTAWENWARKSVWRIFLHMIAATTGPPLPPERKRPPRHCKRQEGGSRQRCRCIMPRLRRLRMKGLYLNRHDDRIPFISTLARQNIVHVREPKAVLRIAP